MAERGAQPEVVSKAVAEANAIFDRMRTAVEEDVERGAAQLNVLDVARKAGLEINEGVLQELQIEPIIPVHPWLPWYVWWPWRPFWCWWWHRYYPWYRWCCPWWWNRCHWYPVPY
jgi:hypothetical protein